MAKYLSGDGLSHLVSKIKTWAAATFAPLSHTHDYTKTRVKGNAESSYRTGDVNLTYANLGTAPIANGGTGSTTATDAANAIFNGLPVWTANPNDDTYLARQDTAGAASYGKVKFSTVWNYIKSKMGNIGYCDGYISTHPESYKPVIIPFINNDIAFLLKRGGSAVVKYDGVVQSVDISSVFDGAATYWGIASTGITEIVIELTLHRYFAWSTLLYIDFGPWYTKTVKVEVMYSGTDFPNDVWTEKYNTTTNTEGFIVAKVSHTPVGASSGGGFNKVRLTFSFANGSYSSTIFRIAQIGILNYGSQGIRETAMSRGIDDSVFRNITPSTTGTYDLGSSSLKWRNLYADRIGNTVQIGSNNSSSIANAGIMVNDVRNATLTPTIIDKAANFYFTKTGTPDTSHWWSLLHVRGWDVGYSAWEIAGPADNSDQRTTPLYLRTSNGSGTWGSWRRLLDSSMLSSSTSSSAEDVSATPKAVKAAYDLANSANTTAGQAYSAATGALAFKVTYSISGSTTNCAAHVYSAGSEVTSSYADSCFQWYYDIGSGWVSLGTGKTKAVTALSDFGGNVKCDFTPTS